MNSAGVDWIAPSIPESVTLCSARGTRDAAVAEWVVGAILDSCKGLAQLRRQQERAQWKPLMPRELAGSKALIVGYGSIGRAVGERLRPFDVTDPEPLAPESPLWRLPNVLLTPHVAGDSPAADQRVYELVGDQIRRHLKGEPLLNVVR